MAPSRIDTTTIPKGDMGSLREQIARTLHEAIVGSDADELIHAPYQNSWEEPKWRRWEQWEEAADAILALTHPNTSPDEG